MFLNLPHFTLQSNSSSTSSAALAILIGSPPHQTMGNGTCVLYCSRHCSNGINLLAQTPAGCYLGPKPALITQHTSLFLFYELIVFLSPATKKKYRALNNARYVTGLRNSTAGPQRTATRIKVAATCATIPNRYSTCLNH